jgi:hypothetical protein
MWEENDEGLCMKEIYAMRRANADWFALEDHGRFSVPLFHSSQDALMARLRNFGMLLFEPVALDARLLKEMLPAGAGSYVDFCMVNDPFAGLARGSRMTPAQLTLLMNNPNQHQTVTENGNSFHAAGLNHAPQSASVLSFKPASSAGNRRA